MTTIEVRTGHPSAPPPDPDGADRAADRSLVWVAGPGVLVGLVSALYGLDRSALWLDESYSLGAIHQLGRTLRETSGTMGGYYVALRAWATVSESTWWLRSLSVLAAVAALMVVGRVAMRLHGPQVARVAVLLTALTNLWLAYAREARSYGFVLLGTALSWLALDHALAAVDDRRRSHWWMAHSALAVALPLFHGLSALQLLPHAGVVAAAGGDRRTWARLMRGLAGSVAVTGALISVGAGNVGDWVVPLSAELLWQVVQMFTSPVPLFTLALLALLAGGVTDRAGAVRAATPGLARARAATPVLWGLAPLVLLVGLSVVRPSLVPRYAIGCTPGLSLLMAVGLDRVSRPDLRRVATTGAVLVLLIGHIDAHRPVSDGWIAATTTVADQARDGDALLLINDEDRPPFEAEWRNRERTPDLDVVGSDRPLGTVLRFEDDPPSATRLRLEAATADRVWVVGDAVFGGFDATIGALTDGTSRTEPTHREVARWSDDAHSIEIALLERRR